jgi:rhamnulokinase
VHAYRDNRTQAGLRRLAGRGGAGPDLRRDGVPNVFYNTSLQLEETVTSCPAITDLATRCLFLPVFNYLLSGRAEVEFSAASTSQLVERAPNRDWSIAALDRFRSPS